MIKWMIVFFPFIFLSGALCYAFDVNPWPLSLIHPDLIGWILITASQFFLILGLVLGEESREIMNDIPER
ncbi:MAG: hypothetical protein AAE987_05250 [Thermoplasmataceae archaeon]|jgi:hypothetical protein